MPLARFEEIPLRGEVVGHRDQAVVEAEPEHAVDAEEADEMIIDPAKRAEPLRGSRFLGFFFRENLDRAAGRGQLADVVELVSALEVEHGDKRIVAPGLYE